MRSGARHLIDQTTSPVYQLGTDVLFLTIKRKEQLVCVFVIRLFSVNTRVRERDRGREREREEERGRYTWTEYLGIDGQLRSHKRTLSARPPHRLGTHLHHCTPHVCNVVAPSSPPPAHSPSPLHPLPMSAAPSPGN